MLIVIEGRCKSSDDRIDLVIPLFHRLVERGTYPDRLEDPFRALFPVAVEYFFSQPENRSLKFFLIHVGDDGKGHIARSETFFHETAQFLSGYLPDACRTAQDGSSERMAGEEGFLEFVVYVICRGILVRIDFVDYDTFLNLDFVFGEYRAGGEFQKKGCSLPEVFLQDSRVKHYLFFGGKCVEVAAQPFEITVDDVGTLSGSAFEYGMLGKMRNPAMKVSFIAGSALYGQGAVAYCIAASLDSVTQPAGCLADEHYFLI